MQPGKRIAGAFLICLLAAASASAGEGLDLYHPLRSFQLTGDSALVENLVLKRDRAEMTFDGTFYFAAPVAGKVRGAVFLGRGSFSAGPPPSNSSGRTCGGCSMRTASSRTSKPRCCDSPTTPSRSWAAT